MKRDQIQKDFGLIWIYLKQMDGSIACLQS